MDPDQLMTRVRGFVGREWWLVLVTVAASVAAAALVGAGVQASYQAQSTFIADTSLSAKYKGIPIPDDVVRDVGTAQVRSAIAASLGISAADVGGLRLSGFGNPQNRLLVAFSSPDRARSVAVVRAADAAVLGYAAMRTAVDRSNYQQAMDDADAAIAKLQASLAAGPLDTWQRADLEFKVWQAQQARVLAKDSVDILSTVYQVQGEPTVSTASKTSALVSRVAAGALAGLFVGLLLAGVREALRRRRDAARP
jgi:hypothetical protein